MSDVQVISGTRRAIKEMADGTIRVQIDIDPTCRSAFWSLFPSIDMPVAIAPLVADFERREPEPEKPKGGALAKLAGMLCADSEFWKFLTYQFSLEEACESDEGAAEVIREVCEIESRSELDWHTDAADRFHAQIRGPWIKWRERRGV
ncbi:hypothetical protein LMG22037_05520 [Paraburkholderia phenoliruptrix]|uniref:Uncharacterized protein n=2 Tax=Burkholderiaceae TaxID=119060 RepID=A0A6J5C9S8_9BURK|nr:hypothetical protein [Paraburkholderia phenoliruptrix]CAB3730259.1 hypothetical protein LMG22037_05520 [Paraburkholderia phenoliruptrix]